MSASCLRDGSAPAYHPRSGTRKPLPSSSECQPVDDVVEAALQRLNQHFTGDAPTVSSVFEIVAELPLKYAVGEPRFLLFAQL